MSRNITIGCGDMRCSANSTSCGTPATGGSIPLVPVSMTPIPPFPSQSNNVNETSGSRDLIYRNSSSFGIGVGNSSSNSLDVITVSRDVIRIVTHTAMGELEIMRVSPIQVAEGDSVSITPRHLAITLDLSKFGIRESGVLFKVSKPPSKEDSR